LLCAVTYVRQLPEVRIIWRYTLLVKRSSFGQLWALLEPYKRKIAGLSLLIAFSASLGQVAPQFIRIVIDELIPRGELRLFIYMGVGMLLFYLIQAAVSFFSNYASFLFTQGVILDIRLQAYKQLLSLPIGRFTKERSGSLTSRVMSDVDSLESMIQAGASRIVGQLFSIIIAFVVLLSMNWLLALLSLSIVVVAFVPNFYYRKRFRIISRDIRARVSEMNSVIFEAVSNIAVVKTFANEGLEYGRFKKETDAYFKRVLERRRLGGLMSGIFGITESIGTAVLLLLGAWFVTRQTSLPGGLHLTTGELTAFLIYLGNLISPIFSVIDFNNILQSGLAALERVDNLLEDTPESEGTLETLPDTTIAFNNVHFTYPEAERLSLNGLNLQVKAGETVALVGPSGGGKSTITKLLSRLYDPEGGEVRIGDVNVRDYKLATLRNAIAHVPQDPTLFSGSVTENIRYAKPDASDAEVVEAATLANADAFVRQLPQGYDTEIGERGVKLSGGQKQRIAIARAILKQAKILVLDEATSSLDSESEYVIQDALDKLFSGSKQNSSQRQGVTSIIVAHRLSTIQNADKIFVIEAGRVAEVGTHRELLSRDGIYKMLYELQFREELEQEMVEL
jgi:ABC-type multidrug transport system fused ATPase/permease subunit